jgi:eukaryotic-like serine/threonine-protein kinase
MPIPAGTRIGAYDVIESLGAGGMGEVYRARDPRLDRDVAVKILPETFAHDADRLARFEREAKTLAALNHPHIAAIYGVEEGPAEAGPHVRALILELVDGATLADRIAQGPIPFDEALPIAHQIVDALETAHEAGVIHRDLKPANIKVRPDGTVKVLDFGLAKLASDPSGTSVLGALSLSPTITSPAATGIGFILGTAAYMAPEQARGRAVDKRADIWAFGCVLFEMLTGRRPFDGEDVTETVGAVIHKEPTWSALPPDLPSHVRLVLQRCVEKNPKQRFRDMGDVRLALTGAFNPPAAAPATAVQKPPAWRRALPLVGAGLIGAIVAAVGAWAVVVNRDTPGPSPSRFVLQLPGTQQLPATSGTLLTLSPDGRTLVYRGRGRDGVFRLFRRTLNQFDAVPVGDAEVEEAPFFSPDGQWIGFAIGTTLKKVPLLGGPSQTIAQLPATARGAHWGADGAIVLGVRGAGVMRVAAAGGTPTVVVAPKDGAQYWYPQFVQGGRAILYTSTDNAPDAGNLQVAILATGERRTLLPGSAGHVLPTGHLVFVRGGSLWAVGFDEDRLQVVGTPVPVVEGVRVETGGAVQYAIANNGTLAYLPGGNTSRTAQLSWIDRAGHEDPLGAPPRAYVYPRISPDGTRVAIDIRDQDDDIWVWDLARRTLTRLTFDSTPDTYPTWSRDGRRLIFASLREKVFMPFWQLADGTGAVERLATSKSTLDQGSMSPDGKEMVLRGIGPDTGEDVVLLSLENHEVRPLIRTRFTERNAEISPDGRWLAYQSNESGAPQVYVRPFPAVDGGRWQISPGGGTKPLWARSGRELIYVGPDGKLMSVAIQPGSAFTFGNATVVLDGNQYFIANTIGRTFDISPDGRRFLFVTSGPQEATSQLNIVLDWFEELKQKAPLN